MTDEIARKLVRAWRDDVQAKCTNELGGFHDSGEMTEYIFESLVRRIHAVLQNVRDLTEGGDAIVWEELEHAVAYDVGGYGIYRVAP